MNDAGGEHRDGFHQEVPLPMDQCLCNPHSYSHHIAELDCRLEIDTLLQRVSSDQTSNRTFSSTTITLYCALAFNTHKPPHVLLSGTACCLWLLMTDSQQRIFLLRLVFFFFFFVFTVLREVICVIAHGTGGQMQRHVTATACNKSSQGNSIH